MPFELAREGARVLIAHLLDDLLDRQGARFGSSFARSIRRRWTKVWRGSPVSILKRRVRLRRLVGT